MASRHELLDSIQPGMTLTKSFFMKIYGYELTWPGFAEIALLRLEEAGCSKARNYYTSIVVEYDHNHEKEMKCVAEWYAKQDFVSKRKGDDEDWTSVTTRRSSYSKKQRENSLEKLKRLKRFL